MCINWSYFWCDKVEDVPGTIIFRFQAPLCFVNSRVFRKRLEMVTHLDEKKMGGNKDEGCIQKLFYKVSGCMGGGGEEGVGHKGCKVRKAERVKG